MDEEEFVTISLLGRNMQFRTLSPGQMLLVQRMGQRAKKASTAAGEDVGSLGAAYSTLMIKVLDVVDTLFVSEQDREDVETAVLARKLDVSDLFAILYGGYQPDQPDDDADPVKAPKALRNKKAATVVKKTANPRRAAR